MRISSDYNNPYRRESGSTYNSAGYHIDGPPMSTRPLSGAFNSAMPANEGNDAYDSRRSSRASSRERAGRSRYNVMYLAASLFEFNISATKTEAGYPYLTYQAGEVRHLVHRPLMSIANLLRYLTSSGRKGSFGLRRIKTTILTRWDGSGRSILLVWPEPRSK